MSSNSELWSSSNIWYLFCAFNGQAVWGFYTVISRYFSVFRKIPNMTIVFSTSIPFLLIGWKSLRKANLLEILKNTWLWILAIVLTLRTIFNVWAASYVSAVIIQLISLLTPFVVSIFSKYTLKEELPPFTTQAMILSSVGSLLALLSGDSTESASIVSTSSILTPTLSTTTTIISNSIFSQESIGIILALLGVFLQAIFMVVVKHLTHSYRIETDDILFWTSVPTIVISSWGVESISNIFTPVVKLSMGDFIFFWIFSTLRLVAHASQVVGIKHVGAAVSSALMPSRLISSIAISMVLLDEPMPTLLQWIGMLIVFIVVSVYLVNIAKAEKQKTNLTAKEHHQNQINEANV